MKKFHFVDLTEITCAFGLLDKDTQERLKKCSDRQTFNGFNWARHDRDLCDPEHVYRQKPKPKSVQVFLYRQTDGTIEATTYARYGETPLGSGEISIKEEKE